MTDEKRVALEHLVDLIRAYESPELSPEERKQVMDTARAYTEALERRLRNHHDTQEWRDYVQMIKDSVTAKKGGSQ